MSTFTRRAAALLAAVVMPTAAVAFATTTGGPAEASTISHAANGKAVHESLTTAIAHLHVAGETNSGYVRSKFKSWIDANHNCRDTRAEVLVAESRTKTTGRCTIRTGKWRDWYDNTTYTKASQLDIDHLVPLEEVWASGAKSWSPAKREAYANDLAEPKTLVAVSLHANRSKGDQEPDEWMPAYRGCRYIKSWVAVKTRWSLSIDAAERADLLQMSSACGNPQISTHLAKVVTTGHATHGGSGSSSGSDTSSGSGSTDSGGGLDPQFSTCTEAIAHGYGPYYEGVDPEYDWYIDRDGDGIVCE